MNKDIKQSNIININDTVSRSTSNEIKIPLNTGFTLVETMFAVMILTFTIVGMMTIVANSLFAARYARDEITANYLLQEAVDYIRNDRDTSVFLQNGDPVDTAWGNFVIKYNSCSNSDNGCSFDVLADSQKVTCPSEGCPYLCYDSNASNTAFYTGTDPFGNCSGAGVIKTNLQRKIVVKQNLTNPDQIDVTATISWRNGGLPVSRSLSTTLMKWQ